MKYDDYSLEDFLTDDFFLNWVRHPDPSNTAFWTNWQKENPARVPVVQEAAALIQSLDFTPDEISEASVARMNSAIQQRIDEREKVIPLAGQSYNTRRWYWLAASVALIAGLVAFLYPNLLSEPNVLISSGYGETKIVFLPDSSRVTLNANSRLSYAKDWQKGSRDVHLEGEAFFEVRKVVQETAEAGSAPAYRKFRVRTEEVTVEVLGTTFDVRHRRGETKVVLKTGKVKVLDNVAGKAVMMKPGDMVRASQQALVKEVVNPATHTAWKDNLLIFDDISLDEIAGLLEDNYDFEVKIETSQLGQKTFRGTFPADDVQLLLQTLSKTLDADIDYEQKTIVFKTKP
ncbi:FecR family protein [Persicitalea jodogahamensis]|uniref:Uncharacterized protein n=1 Tax=Persicitalea jodogahamensis TaxID=402147 RepID=A0A8J3GAH0_9BACT|nr:FecR domain-containing protein [Persicitalea jodogahamensis]GHB73085.1 hypothetical protein GCM10007390_28980 [Persicitalea jodogahamensis]